MALDSRMVRANGPQGSNVDVPTLSMLPDVTVLQSVHRCHCSTPDNVLLTAQLRLIQEVGSDRRRENLPTVSEVAAIIPDIGPIWHQRTFRDMQLQLRSSVPGVTGLQRIDPSHVAYLSLQYILVFPHDDTG
ncbi:hypothetical protein BGW36DRAFT_356334 [Talaromyces proteolyticus]|uniref:Uncharacterized protein n=1 Tax=Talaromyces proteolyticus TaxID=1131652 RepID=A0AAD4PZ35_9EURO|nr:uncharacterized protein BGW36DRAFT_356334 [Talaromyces proteolyticus]KAH8702200.1 hypothetical protein BGW36DRAFT_356334 [Talaromyces proteolyticus]